MGRVALTFQLALLAGCVSAEARGDEPRPVQAAAAREPSVLQPGPSRPAAPPAAPRPRAPGWFAEATLSNAAFETPGAPSVVVHAPPGFDPTAPLHLVVFIHGWRGCARQLAHGGDVVCRDGAASVEGWDLAGRFDEAGVNALFVVPQLAFLTRDGSAGAMSRQGRFAAFVEEMLGVVRDRIGPPSTLDRVASITLMAHSAGYETALAILSRGGVDAKISAVVLFDALYRGHARFADWILADGAPEEPGRRLVSLHGLAGRTVSQSDLLAARLRGELGDQLAVRRAGALTDLIGAHRVVIARADAAHADIPARHMGEVLRALLPASTP